MDIVQENYKNGYMECYLIDYIMHSIYRTLFCANMVSIPKCYTSSYQHRNSLDSYLEYLVHFGILQHYFKLYLWFEDQIHYIKHIVRVMS